ncbi:MAG: type III secretion inner membrane ring lipoprotein SctJ [Planctomycetes bacterium]|nr:type III secretion inner membrane ring lipoprotein SctJ [Planctomycetota bacterium]
MTTHAARLCAVTAILALSVLVAGCQVQLHGELQESEANLVLAALLDAGLTAEKRAGDEGTFAVFVEENEFAAAVRILDAKGLPGRRYDDLGNVFGKVAMFSTPMEERARYLHAMQEELAQTIAQIDGVLSARVHLVLPEQDQLGRSLQTPSAAVFVRHVDDDRHAPVLHRLEIRRLVAAGIPNLDEDRIVVSFFPADVESSALPHAVPWKQVLGLRVAAESVPRVWWLAGTAAALVLLETVIFLLLGRRRK